MAPHMTGTVLFNTAPVEQPSFRDYLRGAIMAFWLSGNVKGIFHFAGSPEEADAAAVTNDWSAVREDFHHALSLTLPMECNDPHSRCAL